ncbi:MAG: 16S rRNA (cytosine1402-N4)-methyltransferase [Paracoccaceae bacterium]|jgi:16S rRNA (cytosine1402-N4)-methyltransferase
MTSSDTPPSGQSGPQTAPSAPHVPVLIGAIIDAVGPISGTWLDGTFGAGGYARQLLDAGAERLIGLDRDPAVFEMAKDWAGAYGDRLVLVESTFSQLDAQGPLDGVVLDLGVSSMQLDQAERGFSFMRDGPLDMRMSQSGPTAADLVNTATDDQLADILYHFGEERASRRIARAIVAGRPFTHTVHLAQVVASCLPRPKPGQVHPATRSFQAIRIAVNDEFGELIAGLEAAERALAPGGKLAVVSFHSLEDRVVKRFMQYRAGQAARGNRYAPETVEQAAPFNLLSRKAIVADDEEVARNPRARSAKLRVAVRTDAQAPAVDRSALGLPGPRDWWNSGGRRD